MLDLYVCMNMHECVYVCMHGIKLLNQQGEMKTMHWNSACF